MAGGPADLDGRLRRGDEILFIDGISVVGSTHRRVISLMGNAALAGEVSLGIRRRPNRSGREYGRVEATGSPATEQLMLWVLFVIIFGGDGGCGVIDVCWYC